LGSVSGRPLAPTPGRPHCKRDSPQGFTSTDYRSRDMSSCPLRARRGRLAEPPITPHFPPPATRPFEYRNRTHTSPLSISLPALSPLKNKAIVRKPSLYPQRLALHYLPTKRRPAYYRTTQSAIEGQHSWQQQEKTPRARIRSLHTYIDRPTPIHLRLGVPQG